MAKNFKNLFLLVLLVYFAAIVSYQFTRSVEWTLGAMILAAGYGLSKLIDESK